MIRQKANSGREEGRKDIKIREIKKIVNKSEELIKYMERINIFAGLIAIEKEIKLDLEAMPIQIDITKTPFYRLGEKKGIEKGKREGLKEGILGIVQAKFGSRKAKLIKNLLDKINDINHLKKIKAEAIKAKTWKDFVKSLKSSPKNKNSESK